MSRAKAIQQEIYNRLEKDWDGYSKEDAAKIATKVALEAMTMWGNRVKLVIEGSYRNHLERAIIDTIKHCGNDKVNQEEFIEQWFKKNGVERPEKRPRDTTRDN